MVDSKRKMPRKHKRVDESKELQDLEQKLKLTVDCECKMFKELPMTQKTLTGLTRSNFVEMTDIQRKAIPLALRGKDVLGAAKTGSGKTLAFLIPIIENLYRMKWGPQDGLGAVVISPTRELAVQIFQVLCKIGKEHAFSAGLVIGGKDLDTERDRVGRMNILICTPGRLLQHLDQTYSLDCSNVQMLVLDEADRILDMGFSRSVNAILDHLPKKRQTMLFSATQTKSVRDLARLSLYRPEYVAVHDKAEHATPSKLSQHYVVTPLPEKLDMLYSFIKTHLKCKAIVFFSSCKQVRFVYETFCKLHPGVPLLQLHGKQKQQKRVEIFELFARRQYSFLFCTDIAARGLDFPAVDWVVQVDCPEDADTYIHRVGRTARYDSPGRALLFLLPSEEEAMVKHFETKKIPIEKIKIRQGKKQSIQQQLQMLSFKDPEIKYLGQKSFVSYLRSVFLKKDKAVFDVSKLPMEEYASSLGLPGAPKIRFVKRSEAKNESRDVSASDAAANGRVVSSSEDDDAASTSTSESESNTGPAKPERPKTKIDRMFQRKNQNILAGHYAKLVDHDENLASSDEAATKEATMLDGDEDEDDFITLKRVDHDLDEKVPQVVDPTKVMSERALKRKLRKKEVQQHPQGSKLIFDDEGDAHALYELETEADYKKAGKPEDQIRGHVAREAEKLKEVDAMDKSLAKEKRKEKRLKRKLREREARDEGDVGGGVQLGGDSDHSGRDEFEYGEPSADEDAFYEEPEQPKKRKFHAETLEDQEELALRLLGAS